MIIVALTGSIGMGKTTTAGFFSQAGIPVFSADETVHRLYQDQSVLARVEQHFPGVVVNGQVDRQKLSHHVVGQPLALEKLEKIIHPLVRQAEVEFLQLAKKNSAKMVVLDIPLFYEKNQQNRVDKVVVVSASYAIQKQRVLGRPNMNEEKFQAILRRQVSDADKRRRADFVIDTGKGFADARKQVEDIIQKLLKASS